MTTTDLVSAGFQPPRLVFSRPAPRGPEYGTFEAAIYDGTVTGNGVSVTWRNGDRTPRYTMTFATLADFKAWAFETF